MTFGDDWGWDSPKDEAKQIYDAFREAGGNFVDTANFYTSGSSERFVGEFIALHREEVVLATKFSNAAPGKDANAGGNQHKNMIQAVEASLKRLGTDYIDLYWLHAWDQITPAEEVMRAFDDLVRAGKVLYVGISDAPASVVAKSNTQQPCRLLKGHLVCDYRTPIATLSHTVFVPQTFHQNVPSARNVVGIPARAFWFSRKAITGHRGDNDIEGVCRATAIGRGIGERTNNLHQFQDRSRSAVRDDQGQGIRLTRADVDEMDVEPVDRRHKLRQGVQFRLHLPPVVVRPPVFHQWPGLGQLHALGSIGDSLLVGPSCRRDASAKVDERLFRNVDVEGATCVQNNCFKGGSRLSLQWRPFGLQPAACENHLTGEPSRVLRGEEDGDGGDVFGLPNTSERGLRDEALLEVRADEAC